MLDRNLTSNREDHRVAVFKSFLCIGPQQMSLLSQMNLVQSWVFGKSCTDLLHPQ